MIIAVTFNDGNKCCLFCFLAGSFSIMYSLNFETEADLSELDDIAQFSFPSPPALLGPEDRLQVVVHYSSQSRALKCQARGVVSPAPGRHSQSVLVVLTHELIGHNVVQHY